MPIVDATKPALTDEPRLLLGEDRRLRRASPRDRRTRRGHAMPAQPPSNSSPLPCATRLEVLLIARRPRRGGPASRARAAASQAAASVRNRVGPNSSACTDASQHILDTCKVPCQDRAVFHDPATFANGFPHETFRALRADDPVSHHDHPTWKRGYWVVARHADVQRVSRDSATFSNAPHPFLDSRDARGRRAGMSELLISQDPPRAHEAAEADQQRLHAAPRRGARGPRPRPGRPHRGRRSRTRTSATWSTTSRSGCRCTSSPTSSGCPRTTASRCSAGPS